MNFKKLIASLFGDAQPSLKDIGSVPSYIQPPKPELIEHKLIERTSEEKYHFELWRDSPERISMMEWMYEEFKTFEKEKTACDEALDFIVSPSTKGFIWRYNENRWTQHDVHHVFDYLQQRVRELGYKKYVSEVLHRHYLKPPVNYGEGQLLKQQWGNILICVSESNGKTTDLKFSATTYTDKLYTHAAEFAELMEWVLR
jgi:hypothetical protein